MGMSEYLRIKIADHILRNSAYVYPGNLYAAILSDVSSGGVSYTELSGASYTRKIVPAAMFGAAVNGVTSNASDIVWAAATTNWGVAKYIAIFDAVAANTGNMLYYGALSVAKYIATSAVFKIEAGELNLELADAFSLYSRNGVLDLTLRGDAFVSSANTYAGLGTVLSSLNASLSEPAGGYARVLLTGATAMGDGSIQFSGTATFRAAGANWGAMTHMGIFDNIAGGNLLFALELGSQRYIYDGDGIIFETNTIIARVV